MDQQSVYLLFIKYFLLEPVQAKEQVSNSDKRHRKNADPHKNAGNTLRIKINKEVRVDEGCGCSRNQNRRIKLQDECLNKKENYIS